MKVEKTRLLFIRCFAMAIIIYLIVGMVCICEPISEPYIWVFYALISKGEPDIADFHSS